MVSILDDIAIETGGKSFKTFKYGFDGIGVPRFDYDGHQQQFTWKRYGETENHRAAIPLKHQADLILETPPLFRFF